MYKKLLMSFKCMICVCLLQFQAAHASLRWIDYNITPNPDHLEVKMCTVDQVSNKTEIRVPILFHNTDEGLLLKITIGNNTQNLHPKHDYLTLDHEVGEKICINYELANPYYPQHFHTASDSFFFMADYALIVTEQAQDVKVKFEFNNWNKSIISNLTAMKPQKNNFSWTGTQDDLMKSFIVSGPYFIRKESDKQGYIISPRQIPNDLINYLSHINSATQEFFATDNNYYTPPNNSFILTKNNPKNLITDGGSAEKGSDFSYQSIIHSDYNKFDNVLKHVLMHEYVHQWLGLKLKPRTIQGDNWFFEGVTDYYAIKLNYMFGYYDANSFFESFNNILQEYYKYKSDNIEMNDELRKVAAYEKLDYQVGFVLSSIMDNQISISNPKYNFDYFVKDVVNTKENLDLKDFLSNIKDKTQLDFTSLIKEMLSSNRILSEHLLDWVCIDKNSHCRKLELMNVSLPDYGFDLFNSIKYFKISGVKPGSAAYKQGLKNNQIIKESVQYPGDDKIYLKIEDDDSIIRALTISPNYENIKIPQYVKINMSNQKN